MEHYQDTAEIKEGNRHRRRVEDKQGILRDLAEGEDG